MLKVTNDHVVRYLYIAVAPTTNHRRLSLTYGNSKLSYDLHSSARTDISPGNFHPYRPVVRIYQPARKRFIRADIRNSLYFVWEPRCP